MIIKRKFQFLIGKNMIWEIIEGEKKDKIKKKLKIKMLKNLFN